MNDGAPLAAWVIVEGDPWGSVILAPSSSWREDRTFFNAWDLARYTDDDLALRCTYGRSNPAHIIVNLPHGTARCIARSELGPHGRVVIPMAVTCR
ncbi:MAG: STY0301 family protein [Acetobacteraceae bacterium]